MPYVKKAHRSSLRKTLTYISIGIASALSFYYVDKSSERGTWNLIEHIEYNGMKKTIEEVDPFYKVRRTNPKYNELKKIFEEYKKVNKNIEDKIKK